MWYVIFYFNAGCSKGTMCNYILKNNTAGIYYPLLYTITISWYTMYHFNHTSKTHLQPSLIHLPPHPAVHKHQQYQHQPVEFLTLPFPSFEPFPLPLRTPHQKPIHRNPRLPDLWFRLMKVCISSSVTKPLGDFARFRTRKRELVWQRLWNFWLGEKKTWEKKERHFQKWLFGAFDVKEKNKCLQIS